MVRLHGRWVLFYFKNLAFSLQTRLYCSHLFCMRPFFRSSLALVSCLSLFGIAHQASAAVTTNEIRSIVRIELPTTTDKTTPSGSGVIIDQDGRVLTSYSAVSKLVASKGTRAIVCLSKDEVSLPVCNLEATLIKTNSGSNLALLQIKRVLSQNEWRTVEEEKIRNGFSFNYITFNKTTTTEALKLSDDLFVLDYALGSNSSINQNKGSVTGFERKLVKDKTTPWLVKTNIISNQKSFGGAVINAKNELVGVPTMASTTVNGYGSFTSLAVINAFIREALTADYINNKIPFVFDGNFAGILGGTFRGTVCPESSRYDSTNKSCTCNNGFFAVGNACILGKTYCQVMYPKQKTDYDIFLKACTCLINNETRICPDNLKKVIVPPKPTTKPAAPKPATSTKPVVATSTKPVVPAVKSTSTKPVVTKATSTPAVKPATTTQTTVEIACKKKTGWSYLKKNNTCVPVGTLVKQADLALCEVVAVPATKLYFLKGNRYIKLMTYRNKQCFVDEASAQKAKYKKSLAK